MRWPVLNGSISAGLAGLFLSPGRGLLIYTPVVLFALCAFLPGAAAARRRHKPLLVTAVVFIILESLVISRWRVGGAAIAGDRACSPNSVPPLMVLMAMGVSAIDRALAPPRIRGAGFVLRTHPRRRRFLLPQRALGRTPPSVDAAPGRLWDWRDNPIARTIGGGFYWEPYAIVGAAFTGGIPAARRRMRELNVNPYEEAAAGKRSDAKALGYHEEHVLDVESGVNEIAANIRMLLMDVDGVLTDGKVFGIPDAPGNIVETKGFDTQDGIALQWLSWKGFVTGVISGRVSPATEARAKQCNMTYVYQGHIEKIPIVEEILAQSGIAASQVAYIGDDLTDVVVMNRVGLSIAPANARPEVKRRVQQVTEKRGRTGSGARSVRAAAQGARPLGRSAAEVRN